MSKARGLADLGNAFDDGALSNRNLIINGAMQVAQRGTSHSVSSGYTLDRWVVASSVTATVTKEEDTVDGKKVSVLKSSASSSTYNAVIQRIEGMRRIQGQTYTLSAWVKGTAVTKAQYAEFRDSSGVVVDTLSQDHTFNGNWQKFEWTFEAPTNASYDNDSAWFNVSFYGGDELSVTMAQLELGDTATPFEHRSYGDELARCKRYYEEIYPNDHTFVKFNSTSAYGNISYEVEKRAAPTVSQSGTFKAYGSGQQAATTVTVVINSAAPKSLQALINSGSYSSFFVRQDNAGILKIDAEL